MSHLSGCRSASDTDQKRCSTTSVTTLMSVDNHYTISFTHSLHKSKSITGISVGHMTCACVVRHIELELECLTADCRIRRQVAPRYVWQLTLLILIHSANRVNFCPKVISFVNFIHIRQRVSTFSNEKL